MSGFTKQEQEKFQRDLEEINLDSQSDLEDSFYAKEMTRMQMELRAVKQAKNDQRILEELKRNREREDEMITEYEEEVNELHRITKNEEKNVIDDKIITEIKLKVAQSNNSSLLQLADQQYNQSLLQQPQEAPPAKGFTKKMTFAEEIKKEEQAIQLKIDHANAEREHLMMQQEDKLAMKYQMECLSQLFSDRFIRPKLRRLEQRDSKIQLASTKLKNTFTNLAPQIANQANVLPKNSPEIALKLLRLNKRKPLRSISDTNAKITAKKMQANPQVFEEVPIAKKGEKEGASKQTLQHQFLQYIAFISKLAPTLQEISRGYNPKFLKFLQQKEKNINYDFNQQQSSNKKQKLLSQVASLQNASDLKQLKLTFQAITNLKGVEHFLNIQDVELQFNALTAISPIAQCQRIIQLNLSHNKIRDLTAVAELPWLRLLNVEHNQVRELRLSCLALEVLWAGHNVVEDLAVDSSRYLRVLGLNNNKLNQLPKLRLYNLEELNLSRNQLRSMRNLEELILLKRLNFSGNRLEQLDAGLVYLYLNELNLSHNYLVQLNLLFLPCLEHLFLNNNRLATRSRSPLYLPNLKQLNLDENRLEGFSPVWELLLYSRKVEYLRYSNNQYFLNLREKTRETYEYIIYKYMPNLKIINESPLDIGIKKYLESNYEIYYSNVQLFRNHNNIIKYLQENINFILREFTFAGQLEKDKRRFIREREYIYYQSVQKIKQIKRVSQFIEQYQGQRNSMIAVGSSLFYHYDQFQLTKRDLYHKIRTLVIKYRYRKQRRLKHYQQIRPQVIIKLRTLQSLILASQTTKSILKFRHLLKGMNQTQAAITIQKMWRGYVRRKIYKRLRSNHKPQDNDSDFQEVDTDFFNQELEKHEFDIENIEGLGDFEDVIIRPEVFEYLQNRKAEEQKSSKQKQAKEGKEKEEKEKNLMVNNFLESQTKLKKKEGKPTQEETMIKEWGIKDQKLLKTLQYKQQKRLQMRKKEEDKLLTAAQRFQRFKRGGH